MATPTSNSTPTTTFSPSLAGEGRYVIDGTKWGGSFGTGVTLTYSFPTGTASFISGYSEFSAWYSTSADERAAIGQALDVWHSVANINFVQASDNSTTVGELRFALTDNAVFAHAYTPFNQPQAGDVWFKQGSWNDDGGGTPKGGYDYLTILHEIGHALGLKHPFESPNVMPASYDNYFFTIMSYTASPWSAASDNYASFYPTTPMYFDLLAIQSIYGRNPNHNAGNTTYTFNDGSHYFQTIDDASGTDTIVFNGIEKCRIDLNIGHYSNVSEAISFSGGHSSRSTVWIGPDTLIERATGGSGNDLLIGNFLGNRLNGRAGNDKINGGDGNDTLLGGAGRDTLTGGAGHDVLKGQGDADRFVFNAAVLDANSDRISGFTPGVDDILLQNAVFTRVGGAGALKAAAFWKGAAAHDANDRVIYQPGSGDLLYDKDGKGGAAPVKIADMAAHLSLTASDFIVI